MAGLHYVAIKINKQASLYPKIIHARPYGVGLSFVKRETKTRPLGVRIARLSWVENSNKMYKNICIHFHCLFCYLKAGLHTAIVWPIYLQRKYMVMQQIILIYPVFSQF